MANVRCGNSFYVDSASVATATASFVVAKQCSVTSILFNSTAAGDSITICDLGQDGKSAGATKIVISNGTAKDSKYLQFFDSPIIFPNGIWISAIAASCNATLTAYTNTG